MLSVIGLSLDLVGAGMLSFGVFRGPAWLYLGLARTPEDAATDQAAGAVGFGLLALGFLAQALPSLGWSIDSSSCENAAAGGAALVVGGLIAYGSFGGLYVAFVRRGYRKARGIHPLSELAVIRWEPRGWRFWHHERENEPRTLVARLVDEWLRKGRPPAFWQAEAGGVALPIREVLMTWAAGPAWTRREVSEYVPDQVKAIVGSPDEPHSYPEAIGALLAKLGPAEGTVTWLVPEHARTDLRDLADALADPKWRVPGWPEDPRFSEPR